MSTIWTTQTPGEVGRMRIDQLDDDHTGREIVGVISDGIPDWVRIPADSPAYAGEVRRVVGVAIKHCPHPRRTAQLACAREVYHLRLDGPGDLRCACCPDHGFQIYRPPPVDPGIEFEEFVP